MGSELYPAPTLTGTMGSAVQMYNDSVAEGFALPPFTGPCCSPVTPRLAQGKQISHRLLVSLV